MNSQRGKASTKASGQKKSQKPRQAVKSQTNDSSRPKRPRRIQRDLVNQRGATGPLSLGSSNRSRVRKSHTIEEDEYIADVSGSATFSTTSYPVNIGQSSTFPWGSKIASLYEKYQFLYLEFYYRREVSEYATNGQAGKVMLSFDFDASDSAPTTKQQVLDTEPHADGMPCMEEIILSINARELSRQDSWYVRPGNQQVNTDIKTYDCGNLYVSTYGCTNTTVVGELRVRYKCIVTIPVLESLGGSPSVAGSYLLLSSNLLGETAAATGVYDTLFASATTPVIIANGINATIASSGLITLAAGSYLIESTCNSVATTSGVTEVNMQLCNVATANTGLVFATSNNGQTSSVNAPSQHLWTANMNPLIWNTTALGTSLALQAAATYASGTALNFGYIKITQL